MKTAVLTSFCLIISFFPSIIYSQQDIEENENCEKPIKKAIKLIKESEYETLIPGIYRRNRLPS